MGIGTNIKAILKEQGKTLKCLSEETGVSVHTLYSITKKDSTTANYETLKKISTGLGVSMLQLLGNDAYSVIGRVAFETDMEMPELHTYSNEELSTIKQITQEQGRDAALQYELNLSLEKSKKSREITNKKIEDLFNLPMKEIITELGKDEQKEELFELFSKLNTSGRNELIKRAKELIRLEEYKKI